MIGLRNRWAEKATGAVENLGNFGAQQLEDLRTKGIGFRSLNEGAIDTTNSIIS